MMDNSQTKIGKHIVDILTQSMYEDSRFVYREYIQNSADAIDEVIKSGLLKKEECEIHINIDKAKKTILILDNGTGIKETLVISKLKNIADSDKEKGVNKGFRGIGRLGGIGYCDSLIFETSYAGEPIKSIMKWDAKKLRSIIYNSNNKEEAYSVIDEVTSYNVEEEDVNKHYFKVIMNNVTNDALLDKKNIETYLSMVAPVPYDNGFIMKQKIYDQLKTENIKIDEYSIFINTDPIRKLYTTSIYKDNNGKKERSGDEIFDIKFFRELSPNGELLFWGWYGVSHFVGVIDDINVGKGIRLRKDNIQIGEKYTLLKLFRDQQRGNYYFFGEVHALSPDLIPNARRDYFSENSTCNIFEKKLREIFHTELHQLYYDASKIRNANKRVNEFNNLVKESENKEFVSNKEKEDFFKQLESKKQEAEKAKKELDKINAKFGDEDTALKKIYERVVDTHKIDPGGVDLENGRATTVYRVDKLSKLSKDQRKLISKVFEVINNVLDKKTAENLIQKIEEEFK